MADGVQAEDLIRPTVILDGSIFNLQALQQLLGLTEESAKKWLKHHKVPALTGRSWVMSGRLMREALEPAMLEWMEDRARRAAMKKLPRKQRRI